MVDYDMHIHTNASDGLWEPERIVKTAKEIGLKGIAVTDHDTVDALSMCSILSIKNGIDFIPGIEISTDNEEFEIHILGYFIDYKNKELLNFLSEMQLQREKRANNIVDKLKNMGLNINIDEVEMEAGVQAKSLGRPHIARVLVKKGYFKDTGEVFKYLINRGKPAFVEKQKVSIDTAVNIIKNAGGIPVLAHPFIDTGFARGHRFEDFLAGTIPIGIKGIEVYHSMHSKEDEKYLLRISKELNLAATGGSDFHGSTGSENLSLGTKGINVIDYDKLKYL